MVCTGVRLPVISIGLELDAVFASETETSTFPGCLPLATVAVPYELPAVMEPGSAILSDDRSVVTMFRFPWLVE